MSRVFDFIVVGGGASGLAASLELVHEGFSVCLVEARDRVGGRTAVEHVMVGNKEVVVDIGGQWVGPPQKNIMALIERYGLTLREQYDSGDNILSFRGKRIIHQGALSHLRELRGGHLERMWAQLDRMALDVDPVEHQQMDFVSMSKWLDDNANEESPVSRFLIEWFLIVCNGCEPEQFSLLAFLLWLKSAGGSTPLIDIKDGAQNYTLVGGMQQLSERMAQEFRDAGGHLQMHAPVCSIIDRGSHVQVHFRQQTRLGALRARKVICAMSPVLAARGISFEPPVSTVRRQLSERMTTGAIIKCVIFFERSFWKERGMSGELICDGFPLSLTYDRSEGDDIHALVAFIGGRKAIKCSRISQEERRKLVIDQLSREFAVPEIPQLVVHYSDHNWAEEEFSGGCYFAYHNIGGIADLHHGLNEPVGNVHWAGTEAASEWIGYIEGALVSGRKTARRCIESLGSRRSKL